MPDAPDPQELAARILDATRGYEFSSFVLGFSRETARDRAGHEELYRRTKIEAGEALLASWSGRKVDFKHPDLRIDIAADGSVRLVPAPLFIAARYRKLSREIPSNRWVHHRCKGRGCEGCRWTGTLAGSSVEELVASPVLASTGGTRAFLHGLGREDTDARMLGHGRPFVLEVRAPRTRTVDLRAWEETVAERGDGLVELVGPARAGRAAMRLVKEAAAEKTYRAWIETGGGLPPDAAARAAALERAIIRQYSPARVMHRRGRDVLRLKHVAVSRWLGAVGSLSVWEVRAAAGTYIKELVSGDGGRTRPSLAEALGVPLRCRALDVLEIHWAPPWELTATGKPCDS